MRCEWIDFIVLCVTINSAWKATHALRLILIGCNVVSDVVGATHMKCVLILFELHICTRRKFLLFSRSWAINVVFVFFFLHLKYNFYSLFFFFCMIQSEMENISWISGRTHAHTQRLSLKPLIFCVLSLLLEITAKIILFRFIILRVFFGFNFQKRNFEPNSIQFWWWYEQKKISLIHIMQCAVDSIFGFKMLDILFAKWRQMCSTRICLSVL